MKFSKTNLKGVVIIDLEKKEDERGFFARIWDVNKFKDYGLNNLIVQCNISFTKKRGSIRGMHYQLAPYEEAKLIRCTKGRIFDVAIDLRKDSETYKKWFSVELTEDNYKMFYIPEGFAHGFQTLEDNCEVFYQVSQHYIPAAEKGIRWDDPFFKIKWPLEPTIISEKDISWKLFKK